MKVLSRWSIILGLLGGTILTSGLSEPQQVLALPQEQIVKLLQPVTVFMLTDDQGIPLIANERQIGVFITQQDAQNLWGQLQKNNPDIAQRVKVRSVPMGEVYKLQRAEKNKPNGFIYSYVPNSTEVEAAKKLLTQKGQQYQGGVPLFLVRVGQQQNYLPIELNNEPRVPLFFDQEQVQALAERFKKEKPELASTVKIDVLLLEGVIADLEQGNDPSLTQIVIIPAR